PARTEAHSLGCGHEPRRELVVDPLVHDHAARSGAALARRPERRPQDPLHRELEIRVVHDDDRVLPAELEADVLEAVGGRLEAGYACLARPGQGDDRYVRMPDDPIADVAAVAVDDVDDTRRDTRLGEQLDEALAEPRGVVRRLEHDRVSA